MATPPPCLRLYKHALESIFVHLNLSELARISSTCRDWSAAVNSMRPIGASTGRGRLDMRSMCSSRLMRHVSTINLCRNIFDLATLCDVIRQSKSLTRLVMFSVALDGKSAVAIADAIAQSKSLTAIAMGCNYIGDVGAFSIAEAIKQSTSLVSVNVCKNQIGIRGASAIAEAIKQSESLTAVDLSSNRISAASATAITEAVKKSKPMVRIEWESIEYRCRQLSTNALE